MNVWRKTDVVMNIYVYILSHLTGGRERHRASGVDRFRSRLRRDYVAEKLIASHDTNRGWNSESARNMHLSAV